MTNTNYKVNHGGEWDKMITTHWDAIVNLMDDDIREQTHLECAPCTNTEFLEAYCKLHFEKYGKKFVAELDNPVW